MHHPFRSKICKLIAKEFCEYENSGSSVWDLTLNVSSRPEWLKTMGEIEMEKSRASKMRYIDWISRCRTPTKIQPMRHMNSSAGHMNSSAEDGNEGTPHPSSNMDDALEL